MEEKNKQCDKMQEDVQVINYLWLSKTRLHFIENCEINYTVEAYEEKKQLLEKFDMLSKKKLWAQFEDSRKVAFTSKQSYLEAKVGLNLELQGSS